MRRANRVHESRVLAPDLIGLCRRCVGEQHIAQEQVAGSAAAQRVAEEPDLFAQVHQRQAEQRVEPAAALAGMRQHRIARQLVEVPMHRQDRKVGQRLDRVPVRRVQQGVADVEQIQLQLGRPWEVSPQVLDEHDLGLAIAAAERVHS